MNTRPPVFYINLASRSDRRAFMEQQFARIGLRAERIEAISSSDVAPAHMAPSSDPRHPWSMSAAEVACMLSHCRAWQMALDRGQPYAIVLEDDVVFRGGLDDLLARDLAPIVGGGILRLERSSRRVGLGSTAATIGSREVRRLLTSDVGSAAYVIGAPMMKQALAELPSSGLPVDAYFFMRGGNLVGTPRTLQVVPAPCAQLRSAAVESPDAPVDSDINASRGGRRPVLGLRAKLHELETDLRYWCRSASAVLLDREALTRRRRRIAFAPE